MKTHKYSTALAAYEGMYHFSDKSSDKYTNADDSATKVINARKEDSPGTELFDSRWNDMWVANRIKFQVLPDDPGRITKFGQALIDTKESFLIYHVDSGSRDKVWSDGGDGTGLNWMGLQLMLLRDELNGKSRRDTSSWSNWIRRTYLATEQLTVLQDGRLGKGSSSRDRRLCSWGHHHHIWKSSNYPSNSISDSSAYPAYSDSDVTRDCTESGNDWIRAVKIANAEISKRVGKGSGTADDEGCFSCGGMTKVLLCLFILIAGFLLGWFFFFKNPKLDPLGANIMGKPRRNSSYRRSRSHDSHRSGSSNSGSHSGRSAHSTRSGSRRSSRRSRSHSGSDSPRSRHSKVESKSSHSHREEQHYHSSSIHSSNAKRRIESSIGRSSLRQQFPDSSGSDNDPPLTTISRHH